MITNVTDIRKYEPVEYWAKLPMGVTFRGDATSVGVDSKDNVYVFNRGSHPVVVFDSKGNVLRWFGQGEFFRSHGIELDSDDNIYLVDEGGHFVQKRTNEGKVLWTIGDPGNAAKWQGGEPFNRPTDIAIAEETGEIFVSDGYGNSNVHKFDMDGRHIKSWGKPGTNPGEFSLPHNIAILGDGKVIVADRENFRMQIFTYDGEFVEQWHIHHPMSVTTTSGDDGLVYVGEMGAPSVQDGVPDLGNRVSILDKSGNLVGKFGASLPGDGADQFLAPHSIAIDSAGSVYVAEVAWTYWWSNQENPPLGEPVSLRKWHRTVSR